MFTRFAGVGENIKFHYLLVVCHVVVVDVAVAVDERNDCVVVVVIVVNVTVLVVSVAAVVVSFDNVPVTRRESRNIFLPPKKYNTSKFKIVISLYHFIYKI